MYEYLLKKTQIFLYHTNWLLWKLIALYALKGEKLIQLNVFIKDTGNYNNPLYFLSILTELR
jgi:hypothetical protein